jgi:cbb3-type cytochrome oxidase subunit 3
MRNKLKCGLSYHKRVYGLIFIFIIFICILLIIFNPNRASFNNAVFEGGSNAITENQEISKNIRDINLKDYNNDDHPLIKRENYLLFSIYTVHFSDTKIYSILGILKSFKLINQ